MNVDLDLVMQWVSARQYRFVADFLMRRIDPE